MKPVLSIEGFSYAHPGATVPSLREIGLEVGEGEFVLLTGPSGAGKSTLVRAACGLAPGFDGGTAAGEVLVGGLNAREHGPGEIARVCATVLQDPERQVVMTTVRAEIALPLESRGLSATQVARDVEETALSLGLGDLLDRPVSELSGGELQRVALAAALAPRPALLLLDEPVSQLDPVAADGIGSIVRRLNEEQGIAVLAAEQRLERLLPAADRVVALVEGRIVCDRSPGEFLEWASQAAPALLTPSAAMFQRAGLGVPPPTVKGARRKLRELGCLPGVRVPAANDGGDRPKRGKARPPKERPALSLKGLWDEQSGGRAVIAGVSLSLAGGEAVALMGRNGAGKSTLMKLAAGITKPTRGTVRSTGRVGLLMQNPGDYLLKDRVGALLPQDVLESAGLWGLADRHPRDLSGGERQRLALAMVLSGPQGALPAALLLDEPTTGMDAARRDELAATIGELTGKGVAVMVATHDAEFAAAFARRVILLGEGKVLADAPVGEVLAGGWHFTTEVARVLGGAGGALLPADGAELIAARRRSGAVH